ncbi:MAG: calcium/sodium antiporter [Clostridiales bacterium]|nr:calcium/sodium antiporter [Clostridiales bacterium]
MDYILLIVGFICLVKGADFFVSGSSAIAVHFNIPTFIIGLTIVAFGTSLPEAAVSVTAAMKGANGIAVGNVLGSNMFNLLIVLAISAVIKECPVSKAILRFEYPLAIIAVAIIPICCIGIFDAPLLLSRYDGIILLAVFMVFLTKTFNNITKSKDKYTVEGVPEEEPKKMNLPKASVISVIGILGIIFGGDLVVDAATGIALSFGIDETLIGLTIVALGTSLPELVTSVVAARKGETDIATGNVIGSNLFNILFVLGLSVTINPIEVTMDSVYDSIILIAVSLIAYIPLIKHKQLNRSWGIIMIVMYAVYLAYIIMRTM